MKAICSRTTLATADLSPVRLNNLALLFFITTHTRAKRDPTTWKRDDVFFSLQVLGFVLAQKGAVP